MEVLMKKFFRFLFYSSFLFVFTLIASLYLGWINFNYPSHYRGVVYYKTSGYQASLLDHSQWYWNWQNIIPHNTNLYVVDTSLITKKILETGSLPSAGAYSQLLDKGELFDYSVEITYAYKLQEDAIIGLYKREILTASLDQSALQNSLEKILRDSFNQEWETYFSRKEVPSPEILKSLEEQLSSSIESAYPFLEDFFARN